MARNIDPKSAAEQRRNTPLGPKSKKLEPERYAFVQKLLTTGTPTVDLLDKIQEKFGVSRRTAQWMRDESCRLWRLETEDSDFFANQKRVHYEMALHNHQLMLGLGDLPAAQRCLDVANRIAGTYAPTNVQVDQTVRTDDVGPETQARLDELMAKHGLMPPQTSADDSDDTESSGHGETRPAERDEPDASEGE